MRRRVVGLMLGGAVILLAASAAMAGWTDDFDGGVFDQEWEFVYVPNSSGDLSQFSGQIVSDALELKDPIAVASGGTPIGYGYVDEVFGGAASYVYATLNPNTDSDMNTRIGVFVRGDGAQAYALSVNYKNGDVELVKNNPDFTQTILDSSSISGGLSSEDRLYAELYASNNNLYGWVYDVAGGNLLGSVSATDNDQPYTAGVAGVFAQSLPTYYGEELRGTFDDVGADTPEPESLVLLVSGGLCMLGCWWRKRRRGKK